jgi:low affinity Fe/Cu permease
MTIAASPFIPSATNIQQEMSQAQDHLQEKLDKQIVVMKAQHQFIQNLQRANNQLKTKLKSLEQQKSSGLPMKDDS